MKPQEKLLAEPTIQPLIDACKSAFAVYESQLLIHADEINHDGTVQRLRRQLSAASDINNIREIQAAIQTYSSPDAQLTADALRRHLRREYAQCREAQAELLTEALRLLTSYRETALQAEREFFASFDLPHQPTAVSSRFDSAIRELTFLRDGTKPEQRPVPVPISAPLPDGRCQVLEWFGIKDILE